jgi:hypothetical protein
LKTSSTAPAIFVALTSSRPRRTVPQVPQIKVRGLATRDLHQAFLDQSQAAFEGWREITLFGGRTHQHTT